ncbi:MAG: IS110 family transposase [Acidobacteriota bacterium]
MEIIVERCCGLDIDQATVVACLLINVAGKKPRKVIKTFSTMTRDLIALRDWLQSEGSSSVGMESTGVYWMPVYAILEGHFELIVGNAQHIKNVPGRKSDVKDAEWIADLVRHGLIKASYVPNQELRALRDLLRYRRKVVENRTAERNRLTKLLEQANVKLSGVIADLFGVSGMLMLKAIVEGQATIMQMAQLAKGKLRKKIGQLELALDGRIEQHHRFILSMQIGRLEQMDRDLELLEARIDEKLSPFREQHQLLQQIPGVDWVVAAVIIVDMGVDMGVFGSAQKAAAWAGVSPGNNESGGKRLSGKKRTGNIFLTTMLVEAATAAARSKGTYLKDKFHRLKARRGYKRAIVAIAHKILISAFHMLSTGAQYQELGETYLDNRDKTRVAANLIRRLHRLGYEVDVKPKAA